MSPSIYLAILTLITLAVYTLSMVYRFHAGLKSSDYARVERVRKDLKELIRLLRYRDQELAERIESTLKDIRPITSDTHTYNKQVIYLCTRNTDYNDLMFVAIHELAHVGTEARGHGQPFQETFRTLLQVAQRHGIWQFHDYNQLTKPYCGIEISAL